MAAGIVVEQGVPDLLEGERPREPLSRIWLTRTFALQFRLAFGYLLMQYSALSVRR